jgi:hypothetical protein
MPALRLSWALLKLLILLNLLAGAFVLALLATSFIAETRLLVMLGARADAGPQLMLGMRLIMLLGLISVPVTQIVLTRLVAMIDTVRAGDPFVPRNAARLQTIAWALLGLELIHLAVGAVAAIVSTRADPLDIGWSFSPSGWLAVLLVFVLARVFDYGTRLRDEVEGTI